MRLLTRLMFSHVTLAACLVSALVLNLFALVDMRGQVRDVRERDLATIDEEEDLYRAGWAIEVAARHGIEACEGGTAEPIVEATFLAPRAALEEKLRTKGAAASAPIREAVSRYLNLADDLMRGDTCTQLRAQGSRRARLRLDEQLTDSWIARVYQLHQTLEQKEDAIARAGTRAILAGVTAGAFALLAALYLSRRIAHGVTLPLAELASAARRVGQGDFAPIPPATGPLEVTELSRDLDRMRAHLAELDALKQQFLASVSHEMRTPLGKIREALALMSDGTAGPLTDRQRAVVDIARRSCEAEIRLVTTLLDLSRLRAGTLLHPSDKQSIDGALRVAVAEESGDAASRDVRVELAMEGAAPPAVLDAPLLERAFANLVRNAVSISRAGQVVHVERALHPRGPDGAEGTWVCVRVRDDGPGIPEEIRDTIFDPFTTREVPGRRGVGVGLGLALAREVVRAHGGDLQLAESGPTGSTFAVWIPLR
ncbi:MAG: HAMP domain-containing histidine kinase [Deltaproteobacteria bacterium]|nr:HAMP domain-containing histidine kinase [Deltaproteobacteria bacterium]